MMNQQFCPNCNTPLNPDGICPNCGYNAAFVGDASQPQNGAGGYQPDAYQQYPEQGAQDYYPQQDYPAQGEQDYYPQQDYPAQGAQDYYPQQDYPAQGAQDYYPQQNYPEQGAQDYYPQQNYPVQGTQDYYPQQNMQNYPVQQGGYQPYNQPGPDPSNTGKKASKKKILAIVIPVVAVILIVVLLFTVIIPAINNGVKDDGTFEVGDTWTVDDQWSLTIKGVYEVTDRYTEHDSNSDVPDPDAVYLIDYEYTNINYYYNTDLGNKDVNTSKDSTKLQFYISPSNVLDENGEEAFRYEYDNFICSNDGADKGDTVHAMTFVGVNNKGNLTLTLTEDTDGDHKGRTHKATFNLDTSIKEPATSRELKYELLETAVEIKIGEKWTVDDQWSLTINSIKKTKKRSKYSDVSYTVSDVYIIDYTYTNINYTSDYSDGLYFFFSSYATDTAGVPCEFYYLTGYDSPEFIEAGKTIHCQEAIAVSASGGFTVDAPEFTDSEHGTVAYYCGFTYTD